MRLYVIIVCVIFWGCLPSFATLTINTEAVKRATVFIYPEGVGGTVDQTKADGTGFIVNVPRKDKQGFYLLLLTARHVLDPSWAGCRNPKPNRVYLRMNLKEYDSSTDAKGTDYVPVDLVGTNQKETYTVSSDPQVDAVVVPLDPAKFVEDKFEFTSVPISLFATEDELKKLSTGDSILSAGLLPGVEGQRRNYPVFKFGAISDVRDEPFYTGCGEKSDTPEKVWFISINLFPGASGSAIFYTPPGSGGLQFGAPIGRPVLIGIQSSSVLSADVAGMTPIGLVFPIIEALHLPDANLERGNPASPPEKK